MKVMRKSEISLVYMYPTVIFQTSFPFARIDSSPRTTLQRISVFGVKGLCQTSHTESGKQVALEVFLYVLHNTKSCFNQNAFKLATKDDQKLD